jgi:hypothetical protein
LRTSIEIQGVWSLKCGIQKESDRIANGFRLEHFAGKVQEKVREPGPFSPTQKRGFAQTRSRKIAIDKVSSLHAFDAVAQLITTPLLLTVPNDAPNVPTETARISLRSGTNRFHAELQSDRRGCFAITNLSPQTESRDPLWITRPILASIGWFFHCALALLPRCR